MINRKMLLDAGGLIIIMSILVLPLIGKESDSKSPPTKNTTTTTEKENGAMEIKAEKFADSFLGVTLAYKQDDLVTLAKYLDNESILIRGHALHLLNQSIDDCHNSDKKRYPDRHLPGELPGEYWKIFLSREASTTSDAARKVIAEITKWVEKNAPLKKEGVKLSKLENMCSIESYLGQELYYQDFAWITEDDAIDLLKLIPYLYRLCDKYPENETDWYKPYSASGDLSTKGAIPSDILSERDYVKWNLITLLLGVFDIEKNKDIGFKNISYKEESKEVIKKCEKVIEWFNENIKYCYYHPEEHRFKLDEDARSNKTSSKEYRVKQPWGKDEGPNKTDPKKKPVK